MAISPLSARARQNGIPGLITQERVATLNDFLTAAQVVRGATEVYEIAAGETVTLGNGPLFLSGVRFRFTANRAWNGVPGIIVPIGCHVDVLNIECTTACTTLQNMVRLMGYCSVGEIRLVAPQQVNNITNQAVSCVNVVGPYAHIGAVHCEAFDKVISIGGRVWREDIEVPALVTGGAHYSTLGSLSVVGYQKALHIQGSRGVAVGTVTASGRSEFAAVAPGRNVVHIDDCDLITVQSVNGRDSTEHGVYVSGGNGDNDAGVVGSRAITFGDIRLVNSGQCGVKAKADDDVGAVPHNSLTIGSLTILGANKMVPDPPPDPSGVQNADGLRLENIEHFNIGSVTVFSSGNYGTVSCNAGIHLSGTQTGLIGSAVLASCAKAALYIRDYRNNNGRVSLQNLLILDAKSHAVHVVSTNGNTTRQMHIKGRADTVAGDLIRIEGPGTEAPSGSESFIEMDYTKVTGSPLVRTGDPDIKVKTTNMNSTFT